MVVRSIQHKRNMHNVEIYYFFIIFFLKEKILGLRWLKKTVSGSIEII